LRTEQRTHVDAWATKFLSPLEREDDQCIAKMLLRKINIHV
jgi:hypothetical protein